MGVVESQKLFSDNSWETVRRKSDLAIKSWIDNEMKWRSCVVVLIGAETANRKWVQYEIEHAWKEGKGIVGIYIDTTFNYITKNSIPADSNEVRLSSIIKTFDSSYVSSKYVYEDIKNNIEKLIEEAIKIRNKYPK